MIAQAHKLVPPEPEPEPGSEAEPEVPLYEREARIDVPDGAVLLDLYEAGENMQQLADRYGCSKSLVSKRIQQARRDRSQARVQTHPARPLSPLEIEQRITRTLVEAADQLRENAGEQAVGRAFATAALHLQLPADYCARLAEASGLLD